MKFIKKIQYGMGDMGVSIVYFAVGMFFMFYLTEYVGMTAKIAGLAIFIGKLWDGINDPIMGWISDKTRSKFGRKRVYLLFGSIPFGLSFMALWIIPAGIPEIYQFYLTIILMLLFGTAYTVVVVPYMALVPIMSDDYDERTQITGIRAILSTLGTIAGGGVALVVNDLTGIRGMAIIFGIYSTTMILIAAHGVREIETREENTVPMMLGSVRDYVMIMKDGNVKRLMGLKFLGAIGTGLLSATIPYYAKYILGNEKYSSYGLAVYIIVSALTIPIWRKLTLKFEKKNLLLISNSMVLIVLALMSYLVNNHNLVLFFVGSAFLGISMASYLLIPYSMVPDLVDYYEHKTGERHESIFFGFWITIHQLGISFSMLFLGLYLEISGYVPTIGVQSQDTIQAIKFAFGYFPGIFLVLAALILRKYEISRARFKEIKNIQL